MPTKILTFWGYSDDNFAYAVNGTGFDEVGCVDSTGAFEISHAGESVVVFGAYASWPNSNGVWGVGVAQSNEDAPLPLWPIALGQWEAQGWLPGTARLISKRSVRTSGTPEHAQNLVWRDLTGQFAPHGLDHKTAGARQDIYTISEDSIHYPARLIFERKRTIGLMLLLAEKATQTQWTITAVNRAGYIFVAPDPGQFKPGDVICQFVPFGNWTQLVRAGDLPEGIVGKVTKYCAEVLPNRPGRDTRLDGLTKWVLDGKRASHKLARIVPRVQVAHPELIGIKS